MSSSRKRPIEPVTLNSQEREYLGRQIKNPRVTVPLSSRYRMILRCADGLPSSAVAAELGVHVNTVEKWRRRFLKDRFEGLNDKIHRRQRQQIAHSMRNTNIDDFHHALPNDTSHWSIR